MKKNILIKQDGYKECGVACLLSIIRYYGGNISIDKLLELTKTNNKGTNFYNLSMAAKELGFEPKGYKVDNYSLLTRYNSPFICQISINNMLHFIVVYKIKNNKVTIMDPSKGFKKITLEDFKNIYTGYILTLDLIKTLPNYEEENYVKSIINDVLKNNKKIIMNLILLSLFVTLFTSVYSYEFQVLIDNLYTDKFNLVIITIIFLNILFLKDITNYLRINLLLYLEEKLDLSIITSTFKRIIFLPYNYYKNKTTGDMTSRINDLFNIKNYISKFIITIFLDLLLILFSFLILFKINSNMALVLLLIVIIYIILFLVFKNNIKNMTNINQENNSNLNSFIVESLNGFETIKGLNVEKIFLKKLNYLYLKLIKNNLYLNKLLNNYQLLNELFESICLLFINLLGCYNILSGNLTIGHLVTFNSLSLFFINPIKDILELYKDYYYVKNSIKRINNLINVHIEKLDNKSSLIVKGDIELKNLMFSYNIKDNILKGIDLKVFSQEKILMLGPSGCGKSTILKLLYKYYQVDRNKILINNYDINDYTLKDIRESIVYVSQQETLYNDTIRNNIILGRDINEEEFLLISKLTKVDKILEKRNINYNYFIEEGGVNLSGGERQRIILARSLLKKSNIILIDEGLNEIDPNLERNILKDIFKYFYDKTFIIVSHRKDNSDLYHRVININNGVVDA